ncbi:MAG: hypothetical protein ACTS5F_01450 [Candidatus Hodgkinia cicadicola]
MVFQQYDTNDFVSRDVFNFPYVIASYANNTFVYVVLRCSAIALCAHPRRGHNRNAIAVAAMII